VIHSPSWAWNMPSGSTLVGLFHVQMYQGKFDHDLTSRPNPAIMVSKGNYPREKHYFRLVNDYDLPLYIYIFFFIYIYTYSAAFCQNIMPRKIWCVSSYFCLCSLLELLVYWVYPLFQTHSHWITTMNFQWISNKSLDTNTCKFTLNSGLHAR
jgi:hypothetical protein